MLLRDHLEDWLERRRLRLRPSTHQSYDQLIRAYLLPYLGDVELQSIDRPLLERTYATLLSRGGRGGRPLAPKTVQYCHGVLHRALEDAVLDGLLDANPARVTKPPSAEAGLDQLDDDLQVWSAWQASDFLAFVEGHRWRNLWHLALGTGARRGELLGLRWVDVDLGGAQVRIRRSLTRVDGVTRLLGTKTSNTRVLSIGASVVEALRREQATQVARQQAAPVSGGALGVRWGLVFTAPDGAPLDPRQVSHEFRAVVRAAPVPVIRLHDLRHTHATLLLEAGIPAKVVSQRLGHATIAMTMDVYSHVLPAMDADAAAKLDAALARGRDP